MEERGKRGRRSNWIKRRAETWREEGSEGHQRRREGRKEGI